MEETRTIEFFSELMRLKALPRTGWLLRAVRDVESVAEHLFGVAVVAMWLADAARARGHEVNVEKVLRMALLHDLSEARTGDLPSTIKPYFPGDTLKHADEQAVQDILQPLGAIGASYLALWHEYEQRTSFEARLVKAADKLDLLLQAREYEKGGAKHLGEFWENAEEDFARLGVEELIADILAALKSGTVQ
ncbi:MAG TPA: HD family hydrolase [Blastocatellia bacterium]|nr:HD family hydrolase [Blastocatellia bacterium]